MVDKTNIENAEHAPIRILVVDDHAVLRAGLRMLLDAEPDMQVVGEAKDGIEALERTQELAPNIVLLDVTMPNMGGLETLRQINNDFPQTRVLILTMHDDEGYLREVLAIGGAGYVLKRAADVELLTAIRAVYQGGTYLHASHSKVLFEIAEEQQNTQAAEPPESRLSKRENQVFQLVVRGYTNQQAADTLDLSVKTVETYRARLMGKLGLHNRAELVRYALQRGLLEEE